MFWSHQTKVKNNQPSKSGVSTSVKTKVGIKYRVLRKASQNDFKIKLNCPCCKKSLKSIQSIAIHYTKMHRIIDEKDEEKSDIKTETKRLTAKQFLRMLNGLSALVDMDVIIK